MGSADEARQYVSESLYLREAMANEVVNYAALARHIAEELDKDGEQSVKAIEVALRRMQLETDSEERKGVLASTTYTMYADAAVLRGIDQALTGSLASVADESNALFAKVQTEKSVTVITVESVLPEHVDSFEQVAAFKLSSPADIEETPGVVALLTQRLGDKDVNIVEMFSCQEETVFAVIDEDVSSTITCLNELC